MKLSSESFRCPDFAFPHHLNLPAEASKCCMVLPVPFRISRELFLPKCGACFGHGGPLAAGMPVPKTAIDEQGELEARQDHIGTAGQVRAMQPEPVACGVEPTAYDKFRSGVLTANTRHQGTSLRRDTANIARRIFHGLNSALFGLPVKGTQRNRIFRYGRARIRGGRR